MIMIPVESPDQIKNQVYGLENNLISTTQEIAPEQVVEPSKEDKRELKEHIFHWWHKIAMILLTAHSIFDLWESISFFLFEYQELDHLLSLHQLEGLEMNRLIGTALINLGQGLVSAFFAVRLFRVKETTEHNIDLIASTLLILSTKFVQDFFVELDIVGVIMNYFSK